MQCVLYILDETSSRISMMMQWLADAIVWDVLAGNLFIFINSTYMELNTDMECQCKCFIINLQ